MILKLDPSSGTEAIEFPEISMDGLGVLSSSANSLATSDTERLSSPDMSSVPEKDVPEPVAGIDNP